MSKEERAVLTLSELEKVIRITAARIDGMLLVNKTQLLKATEVRDFLTVWADACLEALKREKVTNE